MILPKRNQYDTQGLIYYHTVVSRFKTFCFSLYHNDALPSLALLGGWLQFSSEEAHMASYFDHHW